MIIYKKSYLLREIYKINKEKIEDQNELLKESINNYDIAIKLINEDPEKIQNNIFFNFYYEIGYRKEESLYEEINWIIKNENIIITEDKKNKLFYALNLLIKKQNIINIIDGILNLKKIYSKNLISTKEEEEFFNSLENKSKILKGIISSNMGDVYG